MGQRSSRRISSGAHTSLLQGPSGSAIHTTCLVPIEVRRSETHTETPTLPSAWHHRKRSPSRTTLGSAPSPTGLTNWLRGSTPGDGTALSAGIDLVVGVVSV